MFVNPIRRDVACNVYLTTLADAAIKTGKHVFGSATGAMQLGLNAVAIPGDSCTVDESWFAKRAALLGP